MQAWPELSYAALRPTAETLQLWTQVVGKVRLARAPWLNHSWHVPLYVSARGLATSLIPGDDHSLDMEFDFVAQDLVIRVEDGGEKKIPLAAGSVAGFYAQVLEALAALDVPTRVGAVPSEMPDPIAFDQDFRPPGAPPPRRHTAPV